LKPPDKRGSIKRRLLNASISPRVPRSTLEPRGLLIRKAATARAAIRSEMITTRSRTLDFGLLFSRASNAFFIAAIT
jgi:hypothetical protein